MSQRTLPHPSRPRAGPAPVRIEPDGAWCPMAHADPAVSSFQRCPPLRGVRRVRQVADPAVSPRANHSLGAFTGEDAAVCVYTSPRHPALVSFDLRDGSVRWTSPLGDLPGVGRREVSAVLLAKVSARGARARRCVFAANPAELVGYSADGARLWRRSAGEVDAGGIGGPVNLAFTDAGELVTVTDEGWIVKLDPLSGAVVDAYRMRTRVVVGGREYRGTLVSRKSVVVLGSVLYLAAEFRPDTGALPPALQPVHLVRIELRQPGVRGAEHRIRPLAPGGRGADPPGDRVVVGVSRAGGSPSAWVGPDGGTLVFVNAEERAGDGLRPVVACVSDQDGVLAVRWRAPLRTEPGEQIHAAPALHAGSRTLLVGTARGLHVFRGVDALEGTLPSPRAHPAPGLIASGARVARAGVGSPFALSYDEEAGELVAVTNVRVFPPFSRQPYGFLGALAVPAGREGPPRPLWSVPLALTPGGLPAPGVGTFGQPALFEYPRRGGRATGIIVNTVNTGTYVIR